MANRPLGAPCMKKETPAPNPDAYVASLTGWRKTCVESLRSAAVAAARTDEGIKWGHLVYFSNGPVLLIRAENPLEASARITGRYSGLAPAMTALTATFSTVNCHASR